MARLLTLPAGIGFSSWEPVSGPRAIGAASTESLTGFVQTTSSAFGVWRWTFSLPPLKGGMFRAWRGFVAALHGGANAARIPFDDPDIMSWADSGVDVSGGVDVDGITFDNDETWDNGEPWEISRPVVAVAAAAARGDVTVTLANDFWGHGLKVGDMVGFVGVFAVHLVTEEIGGGVYRIWPPLRVDLETTDWATLEPTMAMRPQGEGAANLPRGLIAADGLTITMIEVEHRHVVDHFID